MKKTFGLRLEEETIDDLSLIVKYEKENNFRDFTSSDIARTAVLKYIEEFKNEVKI